MQVVLSTLLNNPGDSSFWTGLPVSRFEDEICWTITKVCHFSRLQVNRKISTILLCLSYFTVNIEHFLINSGILFVILAYNVNGGKSTKSKSNCVR